MNKAQLVHALTERLGDQRTAAAALDEVLSVIVRTVQSGEAVTLTGFGVFERRERAARTGRNPRTGEVLTVAATSVPAFRPGAMFRSVVSGARELPEAAPHARAAESSARTAASPAAPVAASRRRPPSTPTDEAFAVATVGGAPGEQQAEANGKSKSSAKADKKPKSEKPGKPGKGGKGTKKAAAKGDKRDKDGKKRPTK